MGKGLIDIVLDSIFDDEWKGRHGEKLTERELKLVNLLGRHGKTLRNVYLPKENGETSEVDLVYITQKGIFVFESKNYSGWIFGDEKSKYWTSMLPNRQKNRFYNPIKQNRTHIKWMRQLVGPEVPLFSIIVFSERCELKKVTVDSDDVCVIKRDRTYSAVRSIWNSNPDVLTEEKIDSLYESMKQLTDVDNSVKAAHIDRIEERYKANSDTTNKHAPSAAPISDGEMLCPKCGKKLVLRTAKKGPNAGKQFWGCSGFPQCRYTEKYLR